MPNYIVTYIHKDTSVISSEEVEETHAEFAKVHIEDRYRDKVFVMSVHCFEDCMQNLQDNNIPIPPEVQKYLEGLFEGPEVDHTGGMPDFISPPEGTQPPTIDPFDSHQIPGYDGEEDDDPNDGEEWKKLL
jgi:hypothetical protein